MGNVYLKLQESSFAEENYKKTLSVNPEHEGAIEALNNLHKPIEVSIAEEKPEAEELVKESSEENLELKKIETEVAEETKPQKEILITDATDSKTDTDAIADECFQKAVNLLKEKDLEPAIEELNKTLSLKQDHPQARELLKTATLMLNESENLFNQGVSYYSSNDFCESVNCAKKALDLKPKFTKAQDLLAKAQEKRLSIFSKQKEVYKPYIETGQYALAVDALKKAIDENPKEPENHFTLSVVYIKQKEYQYAIGSLQRTLSLDPNHKEAQSTLYDVIKMINSADEMTKYHYKLALIFIEKNAYHKALEELKIIFDISPDNTECKALFSKVVALMSKARTINSNAFQNQNNLNEEIIKYQNLIKSNPNDFEAHHKLGLIYSQIQNYDLAKDYLLKALNINSNHKEAQNSLYDLIKTMNA